MPKACAPIVANLDIMVMIALSRILKETGDMPMSEPLARCLKVPKAKDEASPLEKVEVKVMDPSEKLVHMNMVILIMKFILKIMMIMKIMMIIMVKETSLKSCRPLNQGCLHPRSEEARDPWVGTPRQS